MSQKKELSKDEWLKLIPKLYAMLPDYDQIPKIWRIQIHGKKLIVKSYGFCHWNKVIFLWRNGREFYRLTRNMKICVEKGDDNTFRKEYFKGKLVRKYIGWQNCFVEFCQFLWKYHTPPTQKIFSQAAKTLGLDKKTTDKYINFYQQRFCPKNR